MFKQKPVNGPLKKMILSENIIRLKDPSLVIAWLNQINFRVCYNLEKKQRRYNLEINDYNDRMSGSVSQQKQFSSNGNPEDMVVEIDSKEYIMN